VAPDGEEGLLPGSVLGERDAHGTRPAPEFLPVPVPRAAAADRAGEEERVGRARDADERHHGPSPATAGRPSTSPQYQSVPPVAGTGQAAAQFFPWQRTTRRGSDMRGQTLRSAMLPSSLSRHIRHRRPGHPAGKHPVPEPGLCPGPDPQVEGAARRPGNRPQSLDFATEQGRNVRDACDLSPCRDHGKDVDAAGFRPGDEACRERGIRRPDHNGVAHLAEEPPRLVLGDPATVPPRPQG